MSTEMVVIQAKRLAGNIIVTSEYFSATSFDQNMNNYMFFSKINYQNMYMKVDFAE